MDISVGLGRSSGAVDGGGWAVGCCRVVGAVVGGATALSTPGSAHHAVPMSVTQRCAAHRQHTRRTLGVATPGPTVPRLAYPP